MTKELIHKTFAIKHMVCPRCIESVNQVMKEAGIEVKEISLGKVLGAYFPNETIIENLAAKLKEKGFELIEDHEQVIISQVKTLVVEMIHHNSFQKSVKNSVYLAEKTGIPYHKLSKLFSSLEGITIEKYMILQKIEKVKELLTYGEKSLSEIAFELGYSSSQHLSNQFKSTTGMSVSNFKKLKYPNRIEIDKL